MKHTVLTLFILLSLNLFCQEWKQEGTRYMKMDTRFIFSVDTVLGLSNRNKIEFKIQEYMHKDLELLEESDSNLFIMVNVDNWKINIHEFLRDKSTRYIDADSGELASYTKLFIEDHPHNPFNRNLMKLILSSK